MKKIIFALASCTLFVSCVKDADKDPIDVSKPTYLMDGKWQLKMSTKVGDISDPLAIPEDLYAPLQGCLKDNYLQFKSSSDVTEYEGATRCDNDLPEYLDMKYSLGGNEKSFKMWLNPDDPDNSIRMAGDISYPSIDTFVITYLQLNPDNITTARYTRTYVKSH